MSGPGSGRFVVVVGPDGVGKTTLARTLLEAWEGPTAYVHFRPPLRGGLPEFPPSNPPPGPDKEPRQGSRLLSWLRLARSLVAFWLGYLRTVRPALRRGCLVVGDRWGYGYVGQPHALKFHGPEWLARAGVRWLPQPDLVVNLSAPGAVVVSRKAELSLAAVDGELARWRALPVPTLRTYPAVETPEVLVASVLAQLQRGDCRATEGPGR